jgi:glutamine amidotransferase
MVDGVVDWVKKGNGCLLGICLGMQLLARESDEDGVTEGFGFLHQRVEHFRSDSDHRLRIPHVGFNSLTFEEPEGIFGGLESGSDFYFVHSYRISDQDSGGRRGYTTYGERFLAAIELENVWGAQFHPEKSQSNGLRLLSNFLETNVHSC